MKWVRDCITRPLRLAYTGAPMPSTELRRSLGPLDATLINVGTMLASGIFITPAAIARDLDASSLHLIVWAVAGIFSVLGALVIAELGAMMPEAGGIYIYLERAYGQPWGFLYGWALFVAIQCGSIAAVGVATATYLGHFMPMGALAVKMTAIATILALTWINTRGVGQGAMVGNILTAVKIGAAVALVALGLWAGDLAHLTPFSHQGPLLPLLPALGLSMVAALWCYDGWIHVSYIAGEVREPGRNIPCAAIGSTFIVIALYLALNLAYLVVLGVDGMAGSDLVASRAAQAVVGAAGAGLVAALVSISCLGANNGFILAGARVYYAMAKDGLFFNSAARVDPRTAVPLAALVLQAVWSSLLVFSGRYDQIFTYVIFVEFLFYALAAGAVIVLRRREPAASRPYRVWGYPWTPAAFILFSAALVVSTIWSSPREAAIGVAVMASGVPVYLFWSRRRRSSRPGD